MVKWMIRWHGSGEGMRRFVVRGWIGYLRLSCAEAHFSPELRSLVGTSPVAKLGKIIYQRLATVYTPSGLFSYTPDDPHGANFYEKALFVKADVAALDRGRAQQLLCALRAMLLFAVNKLREVAGGVSDRPDPSIRRPKSAFRVTRRSFQCAPATAQEETG